MVADALIILLCAFSLMAFFFGIRKGRDFCNRLFEGKEEERKK